MIFEPEYPGDCFAILTDRVSVGVFDLGWHMNAISKGGRTQHLRPFIHHEWEDFVWNDEPIKGRGESVETKINVP